LPSSGSTSGHFTHFLWRFASDHCTKKQLELLLIYQVQFLTMYQTFEQNQSFLRGQVWSNV
jgi:hypothetical protein